MEKIDWFKNEILPHFKNYKLMYKDFYNGDLGDLKRIEFENEIIGGCVEFWSSGWIGIHAYDYIKDMEIMNILMEPSETEKFYVEINNLINLIK